MSAHYRAADYAAWTGDAAAPPSASSQASRATSTALPSDNLRPTNLRDPSPSLLPSAGLTRYQAMRYSVPQDHAAAFFDYTNPNTFKYMSTEITRRLTGVRPGQNIIVPDATIVSVLDSFSSNMPTSPEILVMSVIEYIVNHIANETQQERQNQNLSAWVQFKPEAWGMQRHSDIKLREGGPTRFQIAMRY